MIAAVVISRSRKSAIISNINSFLIKFKMNYRKTVKI